MREMHWTRGMASTRVQGRGMYMLCHGMGGSCTSIVERGRSFSTLVKVAVKTQVP